MKWLPHSPALCLLLLCQPLVFLLPTGCSVPSKNRDTVLDPIALSGNLPRLAQSVADDPNSKLYLAIRFADPELLAEALAQGADMNAEVPPMKPRGEPGQLVYQPDLQAMALPMFVHAFNYGNIAALQLLADKGARFAYSQPRQINAAPGASLGDYTSYALYCPDQRRVMVDADGLPTGQFADCHDLYRTLVSGGYRFNRYDMRKILQGQGAQETYHYMRVHADPDELAAFDQSESHRVKRIVREQAEQLDQATTALEYLGAIGQQHKKRADKLGKPLLSAATVGKTICKRGDFHYTSPYHYQVEHRPGVLVARLEAVYPTAREIRFRIHALHTESGHARYYPSHPPRFDGLICVPGRDYRGSVRGWYPCVTRVRREKPESGSW